MQKTWENMKPKYAEIIIDSLGLPRFQVDDIIRQLIGRRFALGYTQADVAKRCDLKQSAIARIEGFGAVPKLDTVLIICKALGMEIKLQEVPHDTTPDKPQEAGK